MYYLRKGLVSLDLRYCHVENLALVAIYNVQRLQHYILLKKTIVVYDANSM
jgi:hypothetical protein